MQLFLGPESEFAEETTTNRIALRLSQAFEKFYGYGPGADERRSWANSLGRLKDVLARAAPPDAGVVLEYQLPLSSLRLDCLVAGRGKTTGPHAEIIELKQWERTEASEEDDLVVTWLRGANRAVLHPAVQVGRYEQYLRDYHSAFYEPNPIGLGSCVYLHNYRPSSDDPLLSAKFRAEAAAHPVFMAPDFDRISEHLAARIGAGGGLEILHRFSSSKTAPSKDLLKHVAAVLRREPSFVLLDEQLVVYQTVLGAVLKPKATKRCIIVKGGPGTGKSVVALSLMADLSGKGRNARYATASKSFTTTLRKIVGARAARQFDYTMNYGRSPESSVDAVIVDEAHRIRPTSETRFMRREHRTGIPQVEEILRAARVSVFFVDDLQAVLPTHVGSSAYIREHAEKLGIDVHEFELDIQFRCKGSDTFVSWVDNLLGLRESGPSVYTPTSEFDFRVLGSPEDLDHEIRNRAEEGHVARVTAGYCWPWSDPKPDGTLVDDVRVGGFARPWNARYDAPRLAAGIPRADLWAYDPAGIDQVGCVYTAQGFEFDYVGVIIGPDISWDPARGGWSGNPEASADRELRRAGGDFDELVKRAYRVLLSRGLKGCYVTATERATLELLRSRVCTKT